MNEVNEGNVRTIIGIDATSSMTDAIGILNLIISTVFTRTFEIIELANVKATFAIEIFAYRNYNVSDAAEAFFCSGFHNNPEFNFLF